MYENTILVNYMLSIGSIEDTAHHCRLQTHYDDDTWPSCSLKSPVIRCFLNSLCGHTPKKTSTSALMALYEGNSPVNSPHKGPVTREMFPFDDVTMPWNIDICYVS